MNGKKENTIMTHGMIHNKIKSIKQRNKARKHEERTRGIRKKSADPDSHTNLIWLLESASFPWSTRIPEFDVGIPSSCDHNIYFWAKFHTPIQEKDINFFSLFL